MTDKIEPALSARQWEYRQREGWLGGVEMMGAQFLLLDGRELVFVNDADPRYSPLLPRIAADELPVVIALANAALKDDDPRKITRDMVQALRELGEAIDAAQANKMIGVLSVTGPGGSHSFSAGNDYAAIADALESYLPPEGT